MIGGMCRCTDTVGCPRSILFFEIAETCQIASLLDNEAVMTLTTRVKSLQDFRTNNFFHREGGDYENSWGYSKFDSRTWYSTARAWIGKERGSQDSQTASIRSSEFGQFNQSCKCTALNLSITYIIRPFFSLLTLLHEYNIYCGLYVELHLLFAVFRWFNLFYNWILFSRRKHRSWKR